MPGDEGGIVDLPGKDNGGEVRVFEGFAQKARTNCECLGQHGQGMSGHVEGAIVASQGVGDNGPVREDCGGVGEVGDGIGGSAKAMEGFGGVKRGFRIGGGEEAEAGGVFLDFEPVIFDNVTREPEAKDVGMILERGRNRAQFLLGVFEIAEIEPALDGGKLKFVWLHPHDASGPAVERQRGFRALILAARVRRGMRWRRLNARPGDSSKIESKRNEFFGKIPYPMTLAWISMIVVTILLLRKREWRLGIFLGTMTIFFTACGCTPLGAALVAGLERPYAEKTIAQAQPAEAVVMLGGLARPSPRDVFYFRVGPLGHRLITAVEVLKQKKANAIVFGGGPIEIRGERLTEGRLLTNMVQHWGLSTGEVIALPPSANTVEEADHALALVTERKWTRVILVTSASHMRRAQAVFARRGMMVQPVACDFAGLAIMEGAAPRYSLTPSAEALRLVGIFVHEKLGWYYYRFRGWI